MAYGTVASPPKTSGPLDVRLYRIPSRASAPADVAAILAIPFDVAAGDALPVSLESRLHQDFNAELAKGISYPQRGPMSAQEFRGYFLGADVIVGVVIDLNETQELIAKINGASWNCIAEDGFSLGHDIKRSIPLENRDWSTSLGFSYYIKPNYPGRSSHLCNAGFVVPASQRGRSLGSVAGRSFLHYGPRCGYRGSVFNLVYANNIASLRIWERLGFDRVGRIPGAGLLRVHSTEQNGHDAAAPHQEEYVDAWVIHGDFAKLSHR